MTAAGAVTSTGWLSRPQRWNAAQEIALCSRLMVQLYRRIGERRIDIVIARPGTADDRHVVAEARRHGIELVQK